MNHEWRPVIASELRSFQLAFLLRNAIADILLENFLASLTDDGEKPDN